MDGFKAYVTAEGRLAPTQESAGKGFTPTTVPYKKADLIGYINEVYDRGYADGKDGVELLREVTSGTPVEVVVSPDPYVAAPTGRDWTPDSVLEWVQDTATNAQVEQLFASLGCRFHEALRRG